MLISLSIAYLVFAEPAQAIYNWWGRDTHEIGYKIGTLMTQSNENEHIAKRLNDLDKKVSDLEREVARCRRLSN